MNVWHKNIVVIGGATGIGLATVKLLLQNNVEHVIIASRNPSKLHNVQKEINDERVLVEAFDISLVGKHNEFIEKIVLVLLINHQFLLKTYFGVFPLFLQ